MRAIFVLALAACALSAEVTMESFRAWAVKHGKTYTAEEEAKRFAVFQENAAIIAKLNARHAGRTTFGFNQFSDLTNAEFAARFTPFNFTRTRNPVTLPKVAADADIDWVAKGVVVPIKDQGQCGSCWAFSATAAVESATAINGGALTSLSEQELVDCSRSYGNLGCKGGLMDSAFKYIIAKNGLCSEADYEYTAADGTCQTCDPVKSSAIKSFNDVAQNDDGQLYAALQQGPVSVAIEADEYAFQHYKSGILTAADCGVKLDHGVLLVGYNSEGNYWIVKNSWGTSWGLEGYVHIARSSGDGACGINMMASYPTF